MARAVSAGNYRRVLLKLSGEILSGVNERGLHQERIDALAGSLKQIAGLGVELAVVVGGGNIFRGFPASTRGLDRETADYMGMLATVINGLALEEALVRAGVEARALSAIAVGEFVPTYSPRQARRFLEDGQVVILTGGTGKPFFSTDTAAALRAAELGADVLLKATKVDGIYDADPRKHPNAKRFPCLTYEEFISRGLSVMDTTAVVLCMENHIPIIVFDMTQEGNLRRVLMEEEMGSIVKEVC
jgi:uridylate kinase